MHPGVIITSALAALVGLAIVAVLVSQRAQTSNVVGQAFTGLGYVIGAAVSPVTGSSAGTTAPTATSVGGQLANSPGSYLT